MNLHGFHDGQLPAVPADLASLRVESPAEDDLLRILSDLHKAAWAHKISAEMRDIHIAGRVRFSHSKECDIDAAAAVVIELFDRRHYRIRIASCAKQVIVEHPAVMGPLLDAHPQVVRNSLLGNHGEDSAGNAEAEVDRCTGPQFHGRAARDNAPLQLRRHFGGHRAEMRSTRSSYRRIVTHSVEELLIAVFNDAVNHNARYANTSCMQSSGLDHLPHLRKNNPIAVMGRKRDGVNIEVNGLLF